MGSSHNLVCVLEDCVSICRVFVLVQAHLQTFTYSTPTKGSISEHFSHSNKCRFLKEKLIRNCAFTNGDLTKSKNVCAKLLHKISLIILAKKNFGVRCNLNQKYNPVKTHYIVFKVFC